MENELGFFALRRIDEVRNMARYYTLWLQTDLFGRTSLMCAWGRIGTTGQVRAISFGATDEAAKAGELIYRRKRARGYVPVQKS